MVDKLIKQVDFLIAFFICLFLLPGRLLAETEAEDYLVVRQLTRQSGLPDQDVNRIYFDSKGYAWISTFGGGLVRYDGDSFVKFATKTDPAFVNDFVNQSCEDGYGRLWVPTAGGMNILDLKTLSWVDSLPGMSRAWRYSHSPGDMNRDANGGLWFVSDDVLYRVSFADEGSRCVVDSLQCNVSNASLMSRIDDVDQDGSAWISLNGRLFKVRPIADKGLSLSEILPGVDIGEDNKATAYLRAGNDVWIGTLKGLYRVNVTSGRFTRFLHSESDRHSLPNDEITGLCLSPEGEVLVGSLGGVSIYNAADQLFDTYGSHPNDYGNALLPGEMVRSIVTRDRQVWVGLEAEGLAILQRKPLPVTNLDVEVLLTGAGRQDKRSDRKGCIYSFHDCTVLEGNIDTKDQFLGNRVRTVVDAQTGGGGAGMAGLRIEARILREREPVIQGNIGAEGAHRNLLDDPARQGVTQLDLLDLEEGGVIDTQVGATVELVAAVRLRILVTGGGGVLPGVLIENPERILLQRVGTGHRVEQFGALGTGAQHQQVESLPAHVERNTVREIRNAAAGEIPVVRRDRVVIVEILVHGGAGVRIDMVHHEGAQVPQRVAFLEVGHVIGAPDLLARDAVLGSALHDLVVDRGENSRSLPVLMASTAHCFRNSGLRSRLPCCTAP